MALKKLVAGNWKMNGSIAANDALVRAIAAGMKDAACTVAVCVPAPYLAQVQALVAGSPIALGAQDLSAQPQGAFTGEQSAAMLKDFGVRYAIVGHSGHQRAHQGVVGFQAAVHLPVAGDQLAAQVHGFASFVAVRNVAAR